MMMKLMIMSIALVRYLAELLVKHEKQKIASQNPNLGQCSQGQFHNTEKCEEDDDDNDDDDDSDDDDDRDDDNDGNDDDDAEPEAPPQQPELVPQQGGVRGGISS